VVALGIYPPFKTANPTTEFANQTVATRTSAPEHVKYIPNRTTSRCSFYGFWPLQYSCPSPRQTPNEKQNLGTFKKRASFVYLSSCKHILLLDPAEHTVKVFQEVSGVVLFLQSSCTHFHCYPPFSLWVALFSLYLPSNPSRLVWRSDKGTAQVLPLWYSNEESPLPLLLTTPASTGSM
jgi:hypothetical protein